MITERVGYFDPFTAVFILISFPVPLFSCWVTDAVCDSISKKNRITSELKKKCPNLMRALICICGFIFIIMVFNAG